MKREYALVGQLVITDFKEKLSLPKHNAYIYSPPKARPRNDVRFRS
jgi:hypothetical protein